ncbi:MAG: hypothetical protein KC543_06225 [Myxococcales bacterium]|nr:hypothetical protein [Myxococcales bacterium]
MIARLLKTLWVLLVLAIAAYVFFFVPVGRYTLFQHSYRILQTDAAKDLGHSIEQTGKDLGRDVRDQVHDLSRSR